MSENSKGVSRWVVVLAAALSAGCEDRPSADDLANNVGWWGYKRLPCGTIVVGIGEKGSNLVLRDPAGRIRIVPRLDSIGAGWVRLDYDCPRPGPTPTNAVDVGGEP